MKSGTKTPFSSVTVGNNPSISISGSDIFNSSNPFGQAGLVAGAARSSSAIALTSAATFSILLGKSMPLNASLASMSPPSSPSSTSCCRNVGGVGITLASKVIVSPSVVPMLPIEGNVKSDSKTPNFTKLPSVPLSVASAIAAVSDTAAPSSTSIASSRYNTPRYRDSG